jgi:hypothetical protein
MLQFQHVKRAQYIGAVLALLASESWAVTYTIENDGAWCWFQDERALIRNGQLAVGSISSQGDIQVARFDLAARTGTTSVLHPALERDDHDSPALLFRSDGSLMAFYSKHGSDNLMRIRETTGDWRKLSWTPERSYTAGLGPGFSYANPFQLSNEGGRIYNFWRGAFWNPTAVFSNDRGLTWSRAWRLVRQPNHRPYVKYASDGARRIHFAYSEAHPNDLQRAEGRATSIFHAYYENGMLYRSDGTPIRAMSQGVSALEATRVHLDADPTAGRAAWIWDLAIDPRTKSPVIAYAVSASGARAPGADHRYYYATFEKGQWNAREIAYAGSALYADELYYSGGIAIDPDRPSRVYLSANVDPATGRALKSGKYALFAGEASGASAWKWVKIASDPSEDLLRPIVPAGHGYGVRPTSKFVLWMQGRYTSYVDYLTKVRLLIER